MSEPPAWMIRRPPGEPEEPGELSPEHRRIFLGARGDVLDKPLCPWYNSSRVWCRDRRHYVKTNEGKHYLFAPYIKNLGGAYLGVGADANYSYIAHARSRFAWLMDYDPVIVRLHELLGVLIRDAESPGEFINRFRYRSRPRVRRVLLAAHDKQKARRLYALYRRYRSVLYAHYRRSSRPDRRFGNFGWLRGKRAYRYIRLLLRRHRIKALEGDLLKTGAVRSIARAARGLGVPIRIYYTSNAEEFWNYTSAYRRNVLSLPFDDKSVAIRTMSPYRVHLGIKRPWHRSGSYWHYVVHGALDYREKMRAPAYYSIDAWRPERLRGKRGYISLIRLPGRLRDAKRLTRVR